ncbi:MAG TPA: flagellar hook-associated protein FlgK [Opitutaceae bacterium]|nr:flagellar hook-associated protein FlgK [Opitutaceae bacterium]
MSGLFSTLGATAQALQAQSVALAVTSKNIANVNNPNYARQYVVFGNKGEIPTPQGPQAMNLQALSIQHYGDALLNQQVITQIGLTSSDSAQQGWLQQAQAGLGQTLTNASTSASSASTATGDGSLASALDGLMNAFQALAAQPTDTGTRQALIGKASTLTQTFQSIDQNLAKVQTDAGTQISSDVSTANTLLANIASLNTEIEASEANNPGSAVDLRDSRETDLEKLAAIIPVNVTEMSNGEDTVTTPDTTGNPVTLVQLGTVQGSLNYAGGVVTGGASATTLGLGAGSIQGSITASTGPIQNLRTNLNSLASELVTAVNSAYNPSSVAGQDFFDPSGTTSATIALEPGLTATTLVAGTGGAGDNSIATAVAALANTTFSTSSGDAIDGTFSSFYATAVGTFGQSLSNTTANLDDHTQVQTLFENQRSSISGVNMDEEMSNLVQFQQAYVASSETFNIINTLLGNEISALGRSSG